MIFCFFIQLFYSKETLLETVARQLELDSQDSFTKYVGVIDAGSTGTRLSVYGFLMPGIIINYYSISKTKPGLHTLQTTEKIYDSINGLIEKGKNKLKNKNIDIKDIPIVFAATAGIRSMDKNKRDNIFKTVKKAFNDNEISFTEVDTISDYLEGLYALESVNFLEDYNYNILHKYGCANEEIKNKLLDFKKDFCDRKITSKDEKYIGVMEMGGGSVQIAYEFDKNDKYNDPLHVIETNKKKIYINALPGWGLVEGMKVLEENKEYKIKDHKKEIDMFDELMKDFNPGKRPDINKTDELFLLAFFYEKYTELGCKYYTTLKEIKEKSEKKCKGKEDKFCKELEYLNRFLDAQNIEENKTLYLLKDIAGINSSWTLPRAVLML
ncbi:hypothetical protein GVAV_000210 [Gurleya vavrai]